MPSRRVLQDVVTCVREGLHHRRRSASGANAPVTGISSGTGRDGTVCSARYPEALARDRRRSPAAAGSALDPSFHYQYPRRGAFVPGLTPQQALERLTCRRACRSRRIPRGCARQDVDRVTCGRELGLIATAWLRAVFPDRAQRSSAYARSQGILCQGRGSAANSAVCYVLGVTSPSTPNATTCCSSVSSQPGAPANRPTSTWTSSSERREDGHPMGLRHAMAATGRRCVRDRHPLSPPRRSCAMSARRWDLSEDVIRGAGLARSGAAEGRSMANREVPAPAELHPRRTRRPWTGVVRLTHGTGAGAGGLPAPDIWQPSGRVRADAMTGWTSWCQSCPPPWRDRQVIEWDKDDIDALKFMKVDRAWRWACSSCLRRALRPARAARKGIAHRSRHHTGRGPGAPTR